MLKKVLKRQKNIIYFFSEIITNKRNLKEILNSKFQFVKFKKSFFHASFYKKKYLIKKDHWKN